MFVKQITNGDPNLPSTITLGQRMFTYGSPEVSNAKELNDYKRAVAEANGMTMSTTSSRTHSVFQDENNALFYYEWVHNVGCVKTIIGTPPDPKSMFKAFFRM
jgi:hypothetical protein